MEKSGVVAVRFAGLTRCDEVACEQLDAMEFGHLNDADEGFAAREPKAPLVHADQVAARLVADPLGDLACRVTTSAKLGDGQHGAPVNLSYGQRNL
jgi:hypothetical protein